MSRAAGLDYSGSTMPSRAAQDAASARERIPSLARIAETW